MFIQKMVRVVSYIKFWIYIRYYMYVDRIFLKEYSDEYQGVIFARGGPYAISSIQSNNTVSTVKT
jgi:hypothetical protein